MIYESLQRMVPIFVHLYKRGLTPQKCRERCDTHNFIIASVIQFPTVKFRLFNGKSLYEAYIKKQGKIPMKDHNKVFNF